MNPELQLSPEMTTSGLLDDLQKKRDGLYASVKNSILYGGLGPWFGTISELEPLPSGEWEISKQKSKTTGVAWFTMDSEKYKGDIRVEWEQYRNGDYFIQVIDDADGFELFNRNPSIIPPDIEIEPGIYICRYGALRCQIMTFSANQWTQDYVNAKGFICWERKGRFQMVGKRLNIIAVEERSRVKVQHGYAVTDWKEIPDGYFQIKKNSNFELEFKMGEKRKKFIRELQPRAKGSSGYAYEMGERIKGRRQVRSKNPAKSNPGSTGA